MNARIKKKWVAALKSGEYEQGFDALCTTNAQNDSFCPLGVLCELHAQETGEAWEPGRSHRPHRLRYYGAASALPHTVCDWADLPSNPGLIYNGFVYTVSTLNDEARLSFRQLADIIQRQL